MGWTCPQCKVAVLSGSAPCPECGKTRSGYKPPSKHRSLSDKIHIVVGEKQRSWSAAEMLQELLERNWVNEWVNVLDVADEMRKMYGVPKRG